MCTHIILPIHKQCPIFQDVGLFYTTGGIYIELYIIWPHKLINEYLTHIFLPNLTCISQTEICQP